MGVVEGGGRKVELDPVVQEGTRVNTSVFPCNPILS